MIAVAASQGQFGGMSNDRFLADDRGRFTANPSPGDYFRLSAHPPDGQPYLVPELEFAWTKGAVKKSIDIKLPRGVLIRGKVTERDYRQAPTGLQRAVHPATETRSTLLSGWQAVVASKDDGSYQIVVPPGKGYLFVYGPDRRLHSQDDRRTNDLFRPARAEANYAHDIIPYEVKAGEPAHELNSELRPGKTVKGRVIGPDGQTVDKAEIIATLHFNYFHLNWRGDITDSRTRRRVRAARARSREAHSRVVPRRRPPVGHDPRTFRQAIRRGLDHPARAVRSGSSAVRRPDGKPVAKHLSTLRAPRHPRPPARTAQQADSRPSSQPTPSTSPTSTANTTGMVASPTPTAASRFPT